MQPSDHGAVSHQDLFSEQSISAYWRLAILPVLVGLGSIVILHQSATIPASDFAIEFFALLATAVLAQRSFAGAQGPMMVATAFAGALLGLGLAVDRIIEAFSLYQVFNLIAEPALLLATGAVCGAMLSTIMTKTSFLHQHRA